MRRRLLNLLTTLSLLLCVAVVVLVVRRYWRGDGLAQSPRRETPEARGNNERPSAVRVKLLKVPSAISPFRIEHRTALWGVWAWPRGRGRVRRRRDLWAAGPFSLVFDPERPRGRQHVERPAGSDQT